MSNTGWLTHIQRLDTAIVDGAIVDGLRAVSTARSMVGGFSQGGAVALRAATGPFDHTIEHLILVGASARYAEVLELPDASSPRCPLPGRLRQLTSVDPGIEPARSAPIELALAL